jgi:putative endonuclease
MEKQFYVYIVTNERNGTLYIGVTSDIIKRIWEHKNKVVEGFTKKYGLDKLVYYEIYSYNEPAFLREKRLKKYRREAKIKLIKDFNNDWEDLYSQLIQ